MKLARRAKWNCVSRVLPLLAAVLLFAGILVAQQELGTILGVVKDASGAIVSGAQVTVTSAGTNEARTVTTGDDGAFRVPALQPGEYSVRVEKAGFSTQKQTGLTLVVAQQMVINPVLQVGATEQQVTVTGKAPMVNTTSSATGSLVNESDVSDLPLNGRNLVDLTTIQPGLQVNDLNESGGGGVTGVFFSASGMPIRSNNFSLDGAWMVNWSGGGSSSAASTTLGVDGVKEYKVLTHSFSAEYGMLMGSQTVIVSKSGTNNWHGDAFEYLRNSVLDARNFFDLIPSRLGRRLPEFQRNNFGGSFGGPIKKDKTFFYAVYEGLRERLGVTLNDVVPAAGCHNLVGVNTGTAFTDVGVAGASTFAAANPGGATIDNSTDAGKCASGLTTASVVPAAIIPMLAEYPLPNGATATSYGGKGTSRVTEDYAQIRVDHNISNNDTLFGRYTIDNTSLFNPTTSSSISSTVAALPQWGVNSTSRNQFLTIGETHIFSATVVNQVRLSYSRMALNITNVALPNALDDPTTLIGPQYSFIGPLPQFPTQPYIVQGAITVTGYTGTGPNTTFPTYHIVNTGTLSDDIYHMSGKHALKFGMLLNRFGDADMSVFLQGGALIFANLPSFMTGISSYYRTISSLPPYPLFPAPGNPIWDKYYVYDTLGFYVQDDYRATSRLTLNLGLRYEIMADLHELNNKGSFIPDAQTSGTYKIGPFLRNYTLRNWSPRVGFAWDVFGNGRTAIRGGAGIYYDVGNLGVPIYGSGYGTPPFSVQNFGFQATNPTYKNVPITLPLPLFNNQASLTPHQASGPQYVNGIVQGGSAVFQGMDYNVEQPYSIQENLSLEQQLPFSTTLGITYIGTRGIHLWTLEEGNPCIPTSVVNGVMSWLTPGANPATSPQCPLGRINPNWQSWVQYQSSSVSWYNGLQVVATKNLSHGLQGTVAYTWSHALDTSQGMERNDDCVGGGMSPPNGPYNGVINKGPSCTDIRQAWRVNLLYRLPGIKSNNIVSKITNGWWVGTIWTIQGGYPFTPTTSSSGNRSLDDSFLGQFGEYPNFSTGGTGTGKAAGQAFPAFNASSVYLHNPTNWFNPYMFQLQPAGFLGNIPRGLLRTPNLREFDASINKDTAAHFLGEQGAIQFRVEFFNILNHANFGYPNATIFTGSQSDVTPYSELASGATTANPFGNAGQITTTRTTSRQIQLALKLMF